VQILDSCQTRQNLLFKLKSAARIYAGKMIGLMVAALPASIKEPLKKTEIGESFNWLLHRVMKFRQPQTFTIQKGPLEGLNIVTFLDCYEQYVLGRYELELLEVLEEILSSGMTAIDIGAHHGYLSLFILRNVGSEGRVFAFEALQQNSEMLQETMRLNQIDNIEVVSIAVSSISGSVELFESDSSAKNYISDRSFGKESSVEVASITLDEYFENHYTNSIDLVKIDVEGHEIEVFSGMKNILSKYHPVIICEFHDSSLFHIGKDYLREYGYEVKVIRFVEPVQVIAHYNTADTGTENCLS
jgi:FkbM family methyltransferase